MRLYVIALSCLCIAIEMASPTQARGWRGLVPLHSTRADVERLLGQPTEILANGMVFYKTSHETVMISYAQGLPCGVGEKYSQWRIPRDTVESILVTPTERTLIADLAIDESKYQKRSGGHRREDVYYINNEDGVSIRVFMGDVMDINLYPGRIDARLSCFPPANTSDFADCKGLSPPSIDFYGSVTIQQERLHLDSFAIALFGEPDATGYIIAYGGQVARVGEANTLLERAKNYLVKVRHLPLGRLKLINGGFHEKQLVQLYIVPAKNCPPVPDPTVDPRDVRIIRTRKVRSVNIP